VEDVSIGNIFWKNSESRDNPLTGKKNNLAAIQCIRDYSAYSKNSTNEKQKMNKPINIWANELNKKLSEIPINI
jgi:hypothetical protein